MDWHFAMENGLLSIPREKKLKPAFVLALLVHVVLVTFCGSESAGRPIPAIWSRRKSGTSRSGRRRRFLPANGLNWRHLSGPNNLFRPASRHRPPLRHLRPERKTVNRSRIHDPISLWNRKRDKPKRKRNRRRKPKRNDVPRN